MSIAAPLWTRPFSLVSYKAPNLTAVNIRWSWDLERREYQRCFLVTALPLHRILFAHTVKRFGLRTCRSSPIQTEMYKIRFDLFHTNTPKSFAYMMLLSPISTKTQSLGFSRCRYQHIEAETNGRHCPDSIFKCIFLNGTAWFAINISLEFVDKGPINNIPALVQIMAWRRSGDKPLSKPVMLDYWRIYASRGHNEYK